MAFQIGQTVDIPAGAQAHQGDVFIECGKMPADAEKMKPNAKGLYVFAEGETTGHVHAIREEEADVYVANDNTRSGGKRFFVVPKGSDATLFHGIPGSEGLPEHDKGDHAWLKIGFKPSKTGKKAIEIVRQRVLDLTDPSNFRQVAD